VKRPSEPAGFEVCQRDELERWKREINLTEFAAARGYRIDRRQSSRSSVVMRHPGTDDKIIIRRGGDQHWTYFSVRDSRDNGSIIDFLQRRTGASLGTLRQELRAWSGSTPQVRPDDYVPTLTSPERDRAAVQRSFDGARDASNSLYLNTRGIRPETLGASRFRGTFRIDLRGNVLFPHHDAGGLCGFESKNYQWTSFSSGGRKALWLSRTAPNDTKLVLAESAIDAISHYQLRPGPTARYGSVAGELGKAQLEIIRRAIADLRPGSTLALAFDADAGGEKLAGLVAGVAQRVLVERDHPPIGKDWNGALKHHERIYIESLGHKRSRGADRGLL
jgi:hypothetical protein